MLWTIMPLETVYQKDVTTQAKSQRIITYRGIPVIVEDANEQSLRVVRLLSTNPADYLLDEIAPGSILSKSL